LTTQTQLPDVFSTGEIARAAGVRPRDVQMLADAGIIQPLTAAGYYSTADAILGVRTLSGTAAGAVERPLFRPSAGVRRKPGMPVALAGTLHAAMLALIAFVTSLGVAQTQARIPVDQKQLRMVYLMAPGPGGGGGGGGRKEPAPPPPAERKGVEKIHSPIPVRKPPPRVEPPPIVRPPEPPPVAKVEAIQPVFAPVVPAAAEPRDKVGIPWKAAPVLESADSHGPGSGGGAGSGQGVGLGEGDGAGIGPGSGGGTGGGPYRPGAGITPPTILREVRPDYTDDGRRRGVEGDVELEIVVRADGGVGPIKLLHGLGAGLDQRAIDAVRQWRFNPARRYGTPVDVIVEVAVEFKLR
jgi:TonB family protein